MAEARNPAATGGSGGDVTGTGTDKKGDTGKGKNRNRRNRARRRAKSHSPKPSKSRSGGGGKGVGAGGGGGRKNKPKAKSKSPTPPSAAARRRHHHQQHNPSGHHGNNHGHHHHHHQHHQHRHHKKKPAAEMTVVVNRVDLYDGAVAVKVEADERMERERREQEAAAAAAAEASAAEAAAGTSPGSDGGGDAAAIGFFDDFANAGGGQRHHPPSPKGQQHQHQEQHQQHHYPNVSRYYFRATSMASSVDEDCYYSATSDLEGIGGMGMVRMDRGTSGEATDASSAVSEPVGGASNHHQRPPGGTAGEYGNVAVVRAPHVTHAEQGCCAGLECIAAHHASNPCAHLPVVDNMTPNPHPNWSVHDKYWAQRRRLFSRFDLGVQLDSEGWYSVTPEIIADHVAARVAELAAIFPKPPVDSALVTMGEGGIVVLDAFCGCGGNSIAFGKLPGTLVSKVVCVDLDRTKLRNAAVNASLYGIPPDRLLFVECNTLRVMEDCYRNGARVMSSLGDDIRRDPNAAHVERVGGYLIGGEDLLPPHIDAVFIDPPWGGVDYGMFGKHGYDLKNHMKIKRCSRGVPEGLSRQDSVRKLSEASESSGGFGYGGGGGQQRGDGEGSPSDDGADAADDGGGNGFDDFFDSFDTGPAPKVSKQVAAKTMAQTEQDAMADGDCVDGVELLKIAASATRNRLVLYDLPKNTNKTSLGQAALAAGYRGNIKLEEHFLNGRLKTVTAYLGSDYSNLLR